MISSKPNLMSFKDQSLPWKYTSIIKKNCCNKRKATLKPNLLIQLKCSVRLNLFLKNHNSSSTPQQTKAPSLNQTYENLLAFPAACEQKAETTS